HKGAVRARSASGGTLMFGMLGKRLDYIGFAASFDTRPGGPDDAHSLRWPAGRGSPPQRLRTYFIYRRVMRCGQDGQYARRTAQAICRYGQAGQRSRRPSWPQPEWDGALWAHLFVGSPRNIDILLRALLLDLHPTSPPSHTCLYMK